MRKNIFIIILSICYLFSIMLSIKNIKEIILNNADEFNKTTDIYIHDFMTTDKFGNIISHTNEYRYYINKEDAYIVTYINKSNAYPLNIDNLKVNIVTLKPVNIKHMIITLTLIYCLIIVFTLCIDSKRNTRLKSYNIQNKYLNKLKGNKKEG